MKRLNSIFFASILGAVFLFAGSASFVDAAPAGTPTPSSPGNGNTTVTQPVTLRWSGVEFKSAGGYILKISGGVLGAAGRKEWIPSTSTSYTVPDTLLVEDEHIWTVQACYGFNISAVDCGPLSSASNFFPALAKAQLDYPGINDFVAPDEDGTITLQWSEVLGADRYSVMLRKDSGIPFSIAFDKSNSNITTPSFKIPANLVELNSTYTWSITPSQVNIIGPPSVDREFFVSLGKPELITPSDRSVRTIVDSKNFFPIKFEWREVEGAETYYFEVFGNTNINPTEIYATSTPSFTFNIGVYEWRVTACEIGLVNCGPSSEQRKFTIRKDTTNPRIGTFTVEPSVVDKGESIKISWDASDQGGSHLSFVEIWRALFNEENCTTGEEEVCDWKKVSSNLQDTVAPTDVDNWTGSTFNFPPVETWWYGLHVIDGSSNRTTEKEAGKRPIKVQVNNVDEENLLLMEKAQRIYKLYQAGYFGKVGSGGAIDGAIKEFNRVTDSTMEVGEVLGILGMSQQEIEAFLDDSGSSGSPSTTPGSSSESSSTPKSSIPSGSLPTSLIPGESATPGECYDFCQDPENNPQPEDGVTCICNPLGSTNFTDIINNILTLLFNFALVLTPIVVIASGVMFVTAGGDPTRISTAKRILLGAAAGFVIILLARGLVVVLRAIIGF